jgi:UDP-3-O-[3-hydroxymyristoyl] glucosamine N-acyltransferase
VRLRPTISCADLQKQFPQLFTQVIGDANRTFSSVEAPQTENANAAIFLSNPRALRTGLESAARVMIVGRKLQAEAEKRAEGRTVLVSPNPELAMAMTIHTYFLPTPFTSRTLSGVHPTAVISPDAQLAGDIRVGAHAVIGAGAQIAERVTIGANAVIEDDVTIGEQTVIHPLAYVGHSTVIGKRCEIHPHATVGKEGFGYAHDEKGNHYRIPHQGRVILEDDVHIGAACTIDRATFGETRIHFGAKFDNRVHIAHNCSVGKNSLITAGFLMAGSSKVGANFITGGNTVISGHLEIGDNVQLGGVSAVTKAITTPGSYGGNPLLPLQAHLKMKSSLTHIHRMRKQLALVMKTLGLKDDDRSGDEV